jgi:hypothetical protein
MEQSRTSLRFAYQMATSNTVPEKKLSKIMWYLIPAEMQVGIFPSEDILKRFNF